MVLGLAFCLGVTSNVSEAYEPKDVRHAPEGAGRRIGVHGDG
jgi:hypothetical protein